MAPLERKVRNNYQKTLEHKNFLLELAKAGLTTSLKFHQNKGNEINIKDYEPTLKNIKNYLFHLPNVSSLGKGEKRRELDKLIGREQILLNSLEQSEYNLELFYEYGFIKYFKKCINHLQTALGCRLTFFSPLTNFKQSKINYFCRDKFCLVSKKRKIEQTKFLLTSSLRKYADYGNYRTSFFTISPKNIPKQYFSKEIFKNFGKVCNKIFHHRLSLKASRNFDYAKYELRLLKTFTSKSKPFDKDPIKNEKKYLQNLKELHSLTPKFLEERPKLVDYFKGFFGVPEVVENENAINLHQHFIILRSTDFEKGFVSKFYIEELIKECFNKWGCYHFKGSSISDIRSQTKSGKSDIDSVLDYLLVDYFLKGLKIQSKSFWKDFIVASEGIRFERSGGILSKNILIKNAVEYECEKQVMYGLNGIYDTSKPYINFGGKKTKKGDYIKSPLKIPFKTLKSLKSVYSLDEIHSKLLFYTVNNHTKKTSFYYTLEKSMFGKNPLLCPFSKEKLEFNFLSETEFKTDIGDISFIYSSLIAISEKASLSSIKNSAENFLDKIFPVKYSSLSCQDEYLSYLESNLQSVTL